MNITEDQSVPSCNRVNGSFCKKSGCNSTPHTADSMAAKCVQCIIYFQFMLNEVHCKVADRADQCTDDIGRPDRNKSCSRCNSNQSDNQSGRSTDQSRLPVFDHIDQHPGYESSCGRNCTCHKCMGCKSICRQGTSCIESKPSEPEQGSSKHNKRNIMDTVRCFFVSFSSAKICCENQGADTGTDVYYISACKVNGADCCKESSLSPDHMSHRIVNKERPQCNKCK